MNKEITLTIDFKNDENGHHGQSKFIIDCSNKKLAKANAQKALTYLKLLVDDLKKEITK